MSHFQSEPWPYNKKIATFVIIWGLEGLHDSYFTSLYVAPYISRSFDQFCFLYFCSGCSLEDFKNEFYLRVSNNSFSNERLSNKTRHEKEVQGNSEMSYFKSDVTLG